MNKHVTKRCPHCERHLPFDAFYRNSSAKDGRASWCKDCTREGLAKARREKQAKNVSAGDSRVLYLQDVASIFFTSPAVIMHKFRAGEFPFDSVDNQGRLYWEVKTIQDFILKRIEGLKSA